MNTSYRTLHACRLCLDTECPLYCIHEFHLTDKIHLLTGIKVSALDELPQHICRCCKFLLHKFLAFKDRSVNAHRILINALVKGQMITTDYVRSIDRILLKLSLPLATTNYAVDCLNKDYEVDESLFTQNVIKQEHVSKGLEEPLVDIDAFSAESYRFSQSVAKINYSQVDPLSDKKPNEIFTDTKVDIFVSELQGKTTIKNAIGDCSGKNYVSCKVESNADDVDDNTTNNCFTEDCNITFKDEVFSKNDAVTHREIKTRSKTKETIIDVIENEPFNIKDKDTNDESSLDVDDVKSSHTTEEEKLVLSTLKVNKETKIDLNLKLASEYITFFEKYLKNHIEDIEEFSEEKQSQLERVQKVLRYNNSKVLKSLKHRELFNDWFECAKKRAKLAKKYNVEIKLFNRREQIEQFELRKQSDSYLNRPNKCHTCYMAFVLELPYKRHLKLHDPGRGPVKCDICQYYYPSRSKLRKHTVEHKANYTCIQCGHVTKTWEVAKRHYLWHNGFKFECKYCSKAFEGCSTYYEHVRMAHPERHDSCHICGEGFLGAAGLSAHIKKVHRQLAVPSAEDNRRSSEDDAGQTGLRKCEECGESFADEELLSNHLKIHKKDFQCELCEMSFVSAISLDVHKKRKHLNIVQRPSKKGYVVRYKNKLKLSGGAPPFVCEKCGRGFKFASSFKAHAVVHSGEKPYPCPECGKRFSQAGSVKLHIKKVHWKQASPCKSQRQTTKKRRIGEETTSDLS